jgi:PPP family 3-phenylpropionic acid transporter
MPYWRLSNFYFFFFASLGVLIPYWSLYLKSLGFGPAAIGELMALIMATKVVAPNIWGWLADHTGRRLEITRLATLLALLAFAAVFQGQSFWWLVAVMSVFSFFWNAALPQFEATTMNMLGDQVHRYSTVRLWGSVGFILAVVAVGALLDSFGTGMVPWVILLLLAGLALSTWLVPRNHESTAGQHGGSLWQVLGRPQVIVVLLVCFLLQASHGPYYTFYSIYLEDNDYSRALIGLLWALGVVAEIGIFLLMHRLLPRYGARVLLMLSLGLTTLRWVLIAWFVDQLSVLLFAQLLHAASFGIYHAVAIHLIHHIFTGRLQGRGQALYSSLSFGAGGAVGSLLSGYLWSGVGATATFMVAAVMSALAFILTWRGLNTEKL